MSGYNDNNNNNNNNNQPTDRGLFTGLYDKISGVSTQSTQWDGNYGNQNQNQGGYNQGGYNQGGYNQGQNQPGYNNNQGGYNQGGYNQGGYNQGQNQGGYNQGGGFAGGCVPPPNQNQGSYQGNATGSGTQNNQYPVVPKSNFGDDNIRYGSKISLKHVSSGRFLASWNSPYNSGSGQQQITCNQWNAGEPEFWQVLPPVQPTQAPGTNVTYNSVIRLKHIQTTKHLHSHPNVQSPISQLQEVSGFGSDTQGDDNDLWIIEKFDYNGQKPSGNWNCNEPIALKHLKTNQYLFSHERNYQLCGLTQNEVACSGSGRDENNKWNVVFH
ncbi:hypothetical protein CONCODRAFT_69742 [Conidiobolus coronatus NRRL 28638]|uniref:MIR domain-containing protein n=1 Tax=Conidiobolus coronatus (strain ATCC 28846 / CBS 209.66 / NRRL 28638) TaxID=796925 RepID=A0A137P9B0_CONC2|nr:hypothetical protein CONCODRAFT_69742 [Conidiobolus coronatus NRRL 28638]|eukprot:KXN71579.1 hypothetical protein CONCODRAFT_69742 [Conidiobolus coronatus NRRL 28638]